MESRRQSPFRSAGFADPDSFVSASVSSESSLFFSDVDDVDLSESSPSDEPPIDQAAIAMMRSITAAGTMTALFLNQGRIALTWASAASGCGLSVIRVPLDRRAKLSPVAGW